MHAHTLQGPGLGLPVPDGKLSNASRPPVSHLHRDIVAPNTACHGVGGGWKSVSRASRWARPQPPPCNSACADVCGALWVVGRARLPHGELRSVWWRFWERLRRARLFPHGAASVSRDSTHSSSCTSAGRRAPWGGSMTQGGLERGGTGLLGAGRPEGGGVLESG